MINNSGRCKNCRAALPEGSTARRMFCNDNCRLRFNRRKNLAQQQSRAMRAIDAIGKIPGGKEVLELIKKTVDLRLSIFAEEDSKLIKFQCKACGQARFNEPKLGDKCSFCGKEEWIGG